MRQQRANSARGLVLRPNLRVEPDIAWVPQSLDSTQVLLNLDTAAVDVLVVGIPRMLEENSGLYPTAATMVGAQLLLVYAAPLTLPLTLTLETQDPAVRTRFGGFLGKASQALVTSPIPTDPVPAIDIGDPVIVVNDIIFTYPGPSTTHLLTSINNWTNVTQGAQPVYIKIDTTALTLTWTAPPLPGDDLRVSDNQLSTAAPGEESVTPGLGQWILS